MQVMFSRILYHSLDHLSYNDDMIKFRRETWKYRADLFDKYLCQESRMITAGSKGEGITSMYDSDIDELFLYNRVLCINSEEELPSQLPHHIIVFLADMENVPAGYTRLKLYRPSSLRNVRDEGIRKCLFESESGEVYLSSTFWTTKSKGSGYNDEGGIVEHDISGPARPFSIDNISFDFVHGLTFNRPKLLQTWASRPRLHEWPSQHTIQSACSFLPQVVPVGAKGSNRQFQEWRFCFIESELTLTHSLNGTQIKLYILLKMIAKTILKQVTGEMSSYIMKNVTYWLSELLPLYVFREEKLVSLVLLALTFLRTAVTRWQNLPYYIIPSRNLLSERLDDRTSRELSDVLDSLLQEGPRLFLRVEKLRQVLETAYQMPNCIVKYGKMRNQVEKNMLALLVCSTLKQSGVRVDKSIEEKLLFTTSSLLNPFRLGRFASQQILYDILS